MLKQVQVYNHVGFKSNDFTMNLSNDVRVCIANNKRRTRSQEEVQLVLKELTTFINDDDLSTGYFMTGMNLLKREDVKLDAQLFLDAFEKMNLFSTTPSDQQLLNEAESSTVIIRNLTNLIGVLISQLYDSDYSTTHILKLLEASLFIECCDTLNCPQNASLMFSLCDVLSTRSVQEEETQSKVISSFVKIVDMGIHEINLEGCKYKYINKQAYQLTTSVLNRLASRLPNFMNRVRRAVNLQVITQLLNIEASIQQEDTQIPTNIPKRELESKRVQFDQSSSFKITDDGSMCSDETFVVLVLDAIYNNLDQASMLMKNSVTERYALLSVAYQGMDLFTRSFCIDQVTANQQWYDVPSITGQEQNQAQEVGKKRKREDNDTETLLSKVRSRCEELGRMIQDRKRYAASSPLVVLFSTFIQEACVCLKFTIDERILRNESRKEKKQQKLVFYK
ncbi:hypothetical protein AKO1_003784 [Acrasis kona]|uniref:Uncharacterized protein n=1 Tax=Acrasis kona TaxID=1008807 RepID=A0AAW2Z8J1_9EUKA